MNDSTVKKLLDLNRQFYQTFALQFSNTRMRLQPGVIRILESLLPSANILDLGCGNGQLSRELAHQDHRGLYVGLDFSPELLAVASEFHPKHPNAYFIQSDISTPRWENPLKETLPKSTRFDYILAFATLHHLPSVEIRRRLLKKTRNYLKSEGYFIHSEWQFLNSPRLSARIQSWEKIGLRETDVEPGDYLLDWRHGGYGLRYVHHFELDELTDLAAYAGFTISKTFLSDGEGGKLGLYQSWQAS